MHRLIRTLLCACACTLLVTLVGFSGHASAEDTPRPEQQADVNDKIQRLWEAIVHDDPSLAVDVFFPREPFLLIKAMSDPGRYYDRLRARFERDIHALHASTPDLQNASFDHFELARRGGYVRIGEEGNRLPYWASRHSRLFYRVGDELRSLEIRVLIAWDARWYVIHLNEFRSPPSPAAPERKQALSPG